MDRPYAVIEWDVDENGMPIYGVWAYGTLPEAVNKKAEKPAARRVYFLMSGQGIVKKT